MNETVKYTAHETDTHQSAKKLTDTEVHAILATRPDGAYVAEADEVAEDKPTVH